MITLTQISRQFKVAKRKKGAVAALGSLFHREYDIVKALDKVSFHVGKGEIVGYIGPNGAGKSTSIKVMSGILTPDSGECSIMGFTPWKDRRQYVKNIGVVFGQRTQLWWDVPVQDSFQLLKSIYKIPEEVYKRNYDMLCEMLSINELVEIPLRQLSLGQRMRCEIGASLLHSPAILFLDEPTIGLDAVSKINVRQFIKQLNKETGVTVILTTHDMNDIEALTDRIIMIGRGKVLYDGSMEEIRSQYDDTRKIEIIYSDGDVPEVVGGRLISNENGRAVIEMQTEGNNVSKLITSMADKVNIKDLTVSTCPVDEIIAKLYHQYRI